jgi:hypothetical protein
MGVVRGIPDLFLPVPKVMVPFGHDDKFPGVLLTDMTGKEIASVCCGLWIEMKRTKRGKHETVQKDWAAYLEACGYSVILCKGAMAAHDQVIAFDIERTKPCAS